MAMRNVLSRPSRVCLGILGSASATDWMIIPDFQPKLGVQGCRVKVRGGLCGVLPQGALSRGAGVEGVLCTGGMATSHKPPQPCTSLWIRPVDNSACGVMKSPGPAPPVRGCRRPRGAGACGKREPRSLSANRLLCMRRLLGLGGWGVRQSIENDMALLDQP